MAPKVSVIIPVFMAERYLQECIDSVRGQTVKDIEIILVDDESPDSCPVICDRAAESDERIQVIHEKNQGAGFARNNGLELATGEYVYFVDADDYLQPDAIELLYGGAKRHRADICFSGIYMARHDGSEDEIFPLSKDVTFEQPEIVSVVLKEMLGSEASEKRDSKLRMAAWQGIYCRQWLEEQEIRFCSERQFISEDLIFQLDALPRARRFHFISSSVYHHISDNPASITHRFNPERFEKVVALYHEERRRIDDICPNEELLERIQRMFLGNTRGAVKQIVAKAIRDGDRGFAIKNIRTVVNDRTVQEVLKEYDYSRNPRNQAIMSHLMQKKAVIPICLATEFLLRRNGELQNYSEG